MPWRYFPNYHQSKDERKAKYRLLRSFGIEFHRARTARDWNISKIETYLKAEGLISPNERIPRELTPHPLKLPKDIPEYAL